MAFPTTLDDTTSLPTRSSGNTIPASDNNDKNAAIIALETKVGTGASVPTTTGHVLKVTGAGATAYGAVTQDDVGDGTTYKQYSQTEKTKLAGITTAATANDTDANLKARANHTGTQTASTISDFSTAADARVAAAAATGTGNIVRATSPTLVTPALGTPASGVMTNATGTATGLTSGITNALKSATTTVDVSAATAPTSGQVLTATGTTAATWQTPSAGGGMWTLISKGSLSSIAALTGGVNNYGFTGLNGNTDKMYKLVWRCDWSSATHMGISINSAGTTGSIHYTQSLVQSAGSTVNYTLGANWQWNMSNPSSTFSSQFTEIIIYAASGMRRAATSHTFGLGANMYVANGSHYWDDTTTNITSLYMISVSGTVSAGEYWFYKVT